MAISASGRSTPACAPSTIPVKSPRTKRTRIPCVLAVPGAPILADQRKSRNSVKIVPVPWIPRRLDRPVLHSRVVKITSASTLGTIARHCRPTTTYSNILQCIPIPPSASTSVRLPSTSGRCLANLCLPIAFTDELISLSLKLLSHDGPSSLPTPSIAKESSSPAQHPPDTGLAPEPSSSPTAEPGTPKLKSSHAITS